MSEEELIFTALAELSTSRITYTMRQKQALKILQSGKNAFLTGPAGSGKTYVLREFIKHLQSKKKRVAITASTGIAATHLDGITIHSWSAIKTHDSLTGGQLQKIADDERVQERFLGTEVLIIDEISMIDSLVLDLVNDVCQAVKRSVQPFGGLQVVLSGDFFQLPPVKKDPILAYGAESWQDAGLAVCYLEEQYRHEDETFLQVLNDIRHNRTTSETEEILGTRYCKRVSGSEYTTKLFVRNADADMVNERELAKLKSNAHTYRMFTRGEDWAIEQLKSDFNKVPEKLELKKGAVVMFIKNNFDMGYVNGTMGKVVDFWEDENKDLFPMVAIKGNKRLAVSYASWSLEDNDEKIAGAISQIPLRLAWAITIHKSQGMTLETAEIDLSRSFGHGMGYVALSRVRSLSTLNLTGFSGRALSVDPAVGEMDEVFRRMGE